MGPIVLGAPGTNRIVAERALSQELPVFLVTPPQWDEVVEVVCDAFRSYPVPRFVLGQDAGHAEARMETLVRFFVMARAYRNEPIFAVRATGAIEGVALVSDPEAKSLSADLSRLREETWAALGAEARARYELFGKVCKRFHVGSPHLHLNILAVRSARHGRGLGRLLLETVHRLVASSPGYEGVSLTTETRDNVQLYRHFGYDVIGHEEVGAGLATWGLYRRMLSRDHRASIPANEQRSSP